MKCTKHKQVYRAVCKYAFCFVLIHVQLQFLAARAPIKTSCSLFIALAYLFFFKYMKIRDQARLCLALYDFEPQNYA